MEGSITVWAMVTPTYNSQSKLRINIQTFHEEGNYHHFDMNIESDFKCISNILWQKTVHILKHREIYCDIAYLSISSCILHLTLAQKRLMASGGKPLLLRAVRVNRRGSSQSLERQYRSKVIHSS